MTPADKINLYESMLRRIAQKVEKANKDADADPWLVLEDIQIAAQDALTHGAKAKP